MSYRDCNCVSPNLSLRLSPERKYSPIKTSKYSPISSKYCCHSCHCCCIPCFNCCCCRICCSCTNPCLQFDYSSTTPFIRKKDDETYLKNSDDLISNFKSEEKCPEIKRYKYINGYSNYDIKLFNDFFKKVMEVESKIEDAKISLAINPDFNCEDAFRLFESNNKGILTKDDIKDGLNLLGIFPTGKKLKLLMKRFDIQKNGFINYADFFDMVVPFEKNYRQRVESRAPRTCCPCRCPEMFSTQTTFYLKNLFNLIIDFENEINDDRKLLVTVRLKLNNIFRLFDQDGKGYFDNREMMEYFDNNGMLENIREADLLFIRLDKNRNGKIYFYEVEDELQTVY